MSVHTTANPYDLIDEMLRHSAEIAEALDMSVEEFVEHAAQAFCDVRCEEVVNCEIKMIVRDKPKPS